MSSDEDQVDDDSFVLFCTVVELAELIRKGRADELPSEFLRAISFVQANGKVCIESLDGHRLQRNLFDDIRKPLTELWEPANDPAVPTARTIRRLILRVTDEAWWDYDVYDEVDNRPYEER